MSERKIDIKRRGKMMGWIGALAVHLMLIIGLLLAGFSIPEPAEEGGMPVLLGQVPEAGGESQLVPVEVAPATEPAEPSSEPASSVPDEAPLITQEEEESAPVKPTPKQEKKKPTPTPTPQPSAAERAEAERKRAEAEKKRVEEARKRAEEEAARKKREAEEATRKKVAGAFGKGAQMGNQGTGKGEGQQGAPTGNSNEGASQGLGGYGSFSLEGRSLGPGGLPKPAYNVADEGKVVVSIVVTPDGAVVSTSIHKSTNTVNAALRKAAEEAARKARFNRIEGKSNQTGTITYYFNLK